MRVFDGTREVVTVEFSEEDTKVAVVDAARRSLASRTRPEEMPTFITVERMATGMTRVTFMKEPK